MKRSVKEFLEDVLENIQDIEDFSKGKSLQDLKKDIMRQKAIIRSFEVIGEAVKNVPNSFREKYPDVQWRDVAGFRDILTHAYFGVKLDRLWNIKENDLPILKKQIQEILKEVEND